MEYRYTGIMLRKREVGETDRFYTFFSRENGKVTAIAKGVRKAEAKLSSSLETATLSEIMVARTRGTGKITGAVLEESYPALHGSYEALAHVTEFLSLLDRLIEPEEKDEALFSLLHEYLGRIERSVKSKEGKEKLALLSEAAWQKLFSLLGYRLELSLCAVTGEKLRSGERFVLSPEAGGIVMGEAIRHVRDGITLSENAIKMLRLFLTQPLSNIEKLQVAPETLKEIRRFRTLYERWIRR